MKNFTRRNSFKSMNLSRTIVSLAVALFFGLSTYAHDFEVDGIYYNITSDNEVEVTTPENPDEYSGLIIIPETVTFDGIKYYVTAIGNWAFSYCYDLMNIDIPNSVKSIEYAAFQTCYQLTDIKIPNSVTSIGTSAFGACSGLTSITIPDSVISIGAFAFSGCFGLTSIDIPNSVTSFGSNAFTDTGWFNNQSDGILYLNNCCLGYKGNEPQGNLTIEKNTRLIADTAFEDCNGLTSIEIPNSVTSIGYLNPFAGCYNITGIVVDNDNSYYDSREDCNAIIETASNTLISGCKNTIIPNTIATIGNLAFYYCKGLTSIKIPNSVTSIEDFTFYGCFSLTNITVESSNPNYDSRENCNAIIETASNTLIVGGKNTIIPNSVTTIGKCAFSGRTNLTNIEIPSSVTSIGEYAFDRCFDLTNIEIPNSVISISSCAFRFTGLTSVTIGNSVTSIENAVFIFCENLTEINCKATTPPTLGKKSGDYFYSSFSDYTYTATLNVPIGCAEAYRNAVEWCNFTNIQEVEFSGVKNVEAGAEFDVAVNSNEICITGVDNMQAISIYNMSGTLVYCGNDVNVSVPASGLYLVKVGNQTMKVLVK